MLNAEPPCTDVTETTAGWSGREPPRDDRLERRDDLRGRDDGVARLVRRGRVSAGARDVDPELVHGRHHRAGRDAGLAEREATSRGGRRRRRPARGSSRTPSAIIEAAPPAPSSAGWNAKTTRPFGRRVEEQEVGRLVQSRDVAVVPARVHPPVRRRERQARLLGDGQRVEVGAQEDGLPGPARVEDGGDARLPERPSARRARARASGRRRARAVSTSSNAVSGRACTVAPERDGGRVRRGGVR